MSQHPGFLSPSNACSCFKDFLGERGGEEGTGGSEGEEHYEIIGKKMEIK